MEDQITINLRALSEEARIKIMWILDQQYNLVEDETNKEAIDILMNFQED